MTEMQKSSEILWKTSSGLTSYPDAMHVMETRTKKIHAKADVPLVWLVEHPPIFTAGTSARAEDLYNPHNFPTYDAGRGGQWTYHGPGQRLVYVMLDLTQQNGIVPPRDLRAYVATLEQWLKASLALLGVTAFTREGRIGLWAIDPVSQQEAKIAALGIRISRWVSWHGVSINLDPTLEDFDGIVPCGIREFGVTSLKRFLPDIEMKDLDHALKTAWPGCFGSIPAEI
ncbi:lipoate-protein ligase B [Neokomagataea thailandica NBRC 106555]|uniref:Octanoyltransferase n=2 Tax=Neokomagataea TaxID=1223423 RepID=A0A4Y6V5W0_9PROT|nr:MULTISPECIES: lipoyl(octanoyl) transferase LipB [Neokomagataea]QDH23956.1 lipoyl(octanoyl) transferase LipB [Neokomagataea tanensis]GBR54568.1 lipoate-protein ligase B [Neokomagataea thailandica NBRC 106555]